MTNYVIQFQSDDPEIATDILVMIAKFKGVRVTTFNEEGSPVVEKSPYSRHPVGVRPRILSPKHITGQAKFVYDALADGVPRKAADIAPAFSAAYPHVKTPVSSIGTLIRTLWKRGFIKQDDLTRQYYRELSE